MAEAIHVAKREIGEKDRQARSCTVRLLRTGPSPGHRRFNRNAQWFSKHVHQLRTDRRYRGRYVAVDKDRVIAASKDLQRLLRTARHRSGQDSLDGIYIQHVGTQSHASVL